MSKSYFVSHSGTHIHALVFQNIFGTHYLVYDKDIRNISDDEFRKVFGENHGVAKNRINDILKNESEGM